jgi:tRNA1Val (adenine37-N6)-methyltransferase
MQSPYYDPMAASVSTAPGLTRDSILNGQLIVHQPEHGYRFSLDAVLLADFAQIPQGKTVLELGAGSGIISLVLAHQMGHGRIIAVELQRRLAACARLNTKTNGFDGMVHVLEKDWVDLDRDDLNGTVDYVVTNPPYRRLGTGRVNPNDEEALARHEFRGSLASAARTAYPLMVPGGSFCVIFPADRLAHLVSELLNTNLTPKRMRLVHSRADEYARLVLVEARRDVRGELTVLPPLFIYEQEHRYTREITSILSGEPSVV